MIASPTTSITSSVACPNRQTVRFKINIESRGSEYSKILYDINGNQLLDSNGKYLNVFSVEMKKEMDKGALRLIHNLKDNYRYFIQSQRDMDEFQENRKNGCLTPNSVYVIYPDEDFDASRLTNRYCAYFNLEDLYDI